MYLPISFTNCQSFIEVDNEADNIKEIQMESKVIKCIYKLIVKYLIEINAHSLQPPIKPNEGSPKIMPSVHININSTPTPAGLAGVPKSAPVGLSQGPTKHEA